MLAVAQSGALVGIDAVPVHVECNTGETGEPRPVVVGLPSAAVKESVDRVFSALANSGYRVPQTKTTINLAPGHLRKEGPLYDLPIALGLLAGMGQMHADALDDYLIVGELSLSGATRPVRGGLALAMLARTLGKRGILAPTQTAQEAALLEDIPAFAVDTLDQAVAFLEGRTELERQPPGLNGHLQEPVERLGGLDFCEVKGQQAARRAVEVAVAGAHNLLLIGPPGSGKSMIAKRIPTIMPRLQPEEFLDILRIYSVSGLTLDAEGLQLERPFRSPHHTISDIGLIGGGTVPGPGEISLAHHGVLFLDEMPEFRRSALEVLRQPMEDGAVSISRSAGKITLPARFMLVAAMNPTPDGLDVADSRASAQAIQRYRSRLSGPLLDRIDLHVEAPALTVEELRRSQPGEPSERLRARVEAARALQQERFARRPFSVNSAMTPQDLNAHCALDAQQGRLLEQAMRHLRLSARAHDRILKVARTIADLEGAAKLATPHLMEAIQYRSLDRGTR